MNNLQRAKLGALGTDIAVRWEPDYESRVEAIVDGDKYLIYEDGLVVKSGKIIDIGIIGKMISTDVLLTLEQARALQSFFRPYVKTQQGDEAEIYVYDDEGGALPLYRVQTDGTRIRERAIN